VLSLVSITTLVASDARADSPWLDEEPSPSAPALRPAKSPDAVVPPASDGRPWRVIATAMLGMRGNQGGLIDSGYRIVGLVGVIMSPVSFALALDHQLGVDNRISSAGEDARFEEWVASARVGWAIPIGTDFWVQIAGGAARVNTRVTRMATTNTAQRASFGLDATATIVWRSGLIASTLVFGATAIPSDRDLVVDNMTFELPARVEPWFGLGVAMMF
jgi:hypothetical protein